MTDKVSVRLTCQEMTQTFGKLAGIVSITYTEDSGSILNIRIPTAAAFGNFGSRVNVKLRIDKNTVHEFRAVSYEGGRANIPLNAKTAAAILSELAAGDSAVVQINESQGFVNLSGSDEAYISFFDRLGKL